MMKTKLIENGYIIAAGDNLVGGTPITDEEYNTILEIVRNFPIAEIGYEYRIREDLTVEKIEVDEEIIEYQLNTQGDNSNVNN